MDTKLRKEAVEQMSAVSSAEDKAAAYRLLERSNALDVAEMLGLDGK
jgi:hypothetical protein